MAGTDPNARIRELRAAIAENEAAARALYSELSALLVEAGRRPPDGSDQPALFETEAQSKLF